MTTQNTNDQPPSVKTFEGGGTILVVGAVLAVLGLGGFAAGVFGDTKEQALYSYLTAYMYGLSIPLGALIFLFTGYLMRMKWSVPLRRFNETLVGLFPIFLVLFIPILLGRKDLYVWLNEEKLKASTEIIQNAVKHKQAYLNDTFFLVRAFLYFAIWIGFGTVLRNLSKRNDQDASYDQHPTAYRLSGLGLTLTAFSLTFAAFDWLMSIMPEWFSTMYGVWYFAGCFVAYFATMILLVSAAHNNGYLTGLVREDHGQIHHLHALGRLLFAFIVFWAYVSYAQGFITYIANKPEEVSWYVPRTYTNWRDWGWLLVFGHFLMPFIILLLRWMKFLKRPLSAAAVWMLLMHYADMYYQVMPSSEIHQGGIGFHWLDVACFLGIIGAMLAGGVFLLRGRLISPKNDIYLNKGRRYHSP